MLLLPAFVLAGLGIGCGETAQSAAVAALAPGQLRGPAFGLLATVQAGGNLIASAVAGLLWSAVSPAGGVRVPGRCDDHRGGAHHYGRARLRGAGR